MKKIENIISPQNEKIIEWNHSSLSYKFINSKLKNIIKLSNLLLFTTQLEQYCYKWF